MTDNKKPQPSEAELTEEARELVQKIKVFNDTVDKANVEKKPFVKRLHAVKGMLTTIAVNKDI